jgi:hypothetical protein
LNGSPTVSPMTLAASASDPGGHHLDDVEHQAPAEHIVGDLGYDRAFHILGGYDLPSIREQRSR